jgi:hypothetical protein
VKRLLELTLRGTTSPDFYKNGTIDSRIAKSFREKSSTSQVSSNSGDLLKNGSLHSSDLLDPNNGVAFRGTLPHHAHREGEVGARDSYHDPNNGVHFEGTEFLGAAVQKQGNLEARFLKDAETHLSDFLRQTNGKANERRAAFLKEADVEVDEMKAEEGLRTGDTGLESRKDDINTGPAVDEKDLGAKLDETGVQLAEVKLVDAGVGVQKDEGGQLEADMNQKIQADQGMNLNEEEADRHVEVGVDEARAALGERVGGAEMDGEGRTVNEETANVDVETKATNKRQNINKDDTEAVDNDVDMAEPGSIDAAADVNVGMGESGLVEAGAEGRSDIDETGMFDAAADVNVGIGDPVLDEVDAEASAAMGETRLFEGAADVNVEMDESVLVEEDADFEADNDRAGLVEGDPDVAMRVDDVALDMELMDEPEVYTDTAKLLAKEMEDSERYSYTNQGADDLELS